MAGERTIGALNVSVKANTTKFTESMKRASSRIDRMKRAIPGLNAAFSKMGALTAGLAGGGMLLMLKKTAENIDAQAKFADRIGASLKGLGGLEHAASLTGVKVEALRMGLQRMTRRVAEAAKGTGEAKDALKELGLDAGKLTQMRPEIAFQHIAEAMKGVEGQADRVRLAMKLFDSEGVALVNTLALGADGLDKATKEAIKYGIALSRVDAAKVEAANDALERVEAVISGALRSAVVELAPLVKVLADRFTEWASDTGSVRNSFLGFAEKVVGGWAAIEGSINAAHRAWLAFKAVSVESDIRNAEALKKFSLGPITGNTPVTRAHLANSRFELKQLKAQINSIETYAQVVGRVKKQFEDLNQEIKTAAAHIAQGTVEVEDFGEVGAAAMAAMNGDIGGLMEAWGRVIIEEKEAAAETVKLAGESKVIKDLVSDQVKLWDEVGKSINKALKEQEDFTKGIERQIELLNASESARGRISLGHELEDLRAEGSALGVQNLDGLLGRLETARLAEMSRELGDKVGKKMGKKAAQSFTDTFTEQVNARHQEIVATFDFIGQSLGDVISAGVLGGVDSAAEAAKQVMERLIRDIIDMVIRSGLLQLMNSVFGAAGGGAGGAVGTVSTIANTFTGNGGGGSFGGGGGAGAGAVVDIVTGGGGGSGGGASCGPGG